MELVKDVVRGIVIGVANIVPGVSGGTIMVSMGIYDKVIGAVTGIFKHMKESIRLLLPYAIGMGIGIIALSFAIEYLFEGFPLQTSLLFLGLIFGGIPLIIGKIEGGGLHIYELMVCIIFFALIVWNESWNEGNAKILQAEPREMVEMFLIGVLAAATMVIPGVSGSMILMAMGYYTPIIACVNACLVALISFQIDVVWQCIGVLAPFAVGIGVGAIMTARLMEYLLQKHERITYFGILGLVMASPFAVIGGIPLGEMELGTVTSGVILFGIGLFVALKLAK